jgi:hypothetical protein
VLFAEFFFQHAPFDAGSDALPRLRRTDPLWINWIAVMALVMWRPEWPRVCLVQKVAALPGVRCFASGAWMAAVDASPEVPDYEAAL